MSALSHNKLKINCNAVNSGSLNNNSSLEETELAQKQSLTKALINNGTKLNQSPSDHNIFEPVEANTSILKQSPNSTIPYSKQSSNDVKKVLIQEQELQKHLYSGVNVANGWLRVKHNNKVIYISPSGIGLASLKQVKDYLLTRGTCKCGLPFPLRIELFFNFNIEKPTVPLKVPIEQIKFDPNCRHRKKWTTTNSLENNHANDLISNEKIINSKKRTKSKECLLPSYITSANKLIHQNSKITSGKSAVMIVNSSNVLSTNNIQQQPVQSQTTQQKQQQQQITFHQPQLLQQQNDIQNAVNVRFIESGNEGNEKLPPWKKKSMQNQFGNSNINTQQPIVSTTSTFTSQNAIPIFQINGQMFTIDQQNQAFSNHPQQIQIIDDSDKANARKRPPTFKEDPTGYLNQQTALLHNTITTIHSPDRNTSPHMQQENSSENQPRIQRQLFQQIIKSPNQFSTIGTHNMPTVQKQNCDINHQKQDIHEKIEQQHQNKFRTNPKGRPPKHAKRLISVSQESPVSSSTTKTMLKISKYITPDTTSSGLDDGQSSSNYDEIESLKFAHNSAKQEFARTSVSHTVTAKSSASSITTSTSCSNPLRKSLTTTSTMSMIDNNKPQTISTLIKNNNNNNISNNVTNQSTSNVMMTVNGQQFIVMPSPSIQTHPQNVLINNNAIVHVQNSNQNSNQRLIQTTGQNGNLIIQTGNGNVLTTNQGNFIVSGHPINQSIVLQNGQIIQNNSNLISSHKNNTIVAGSSTLSSKSINTENNQQVLGQQSVLLQNTIMPHHTIVRDPSFLQTTAHHQQVQQNKIILNPEKRKGRKRKIPLNESSSVTIQQQVNQQSNVIHIPVSAAPQNFQISTPNIFVQQNKFAQPSQTIIQQPVNFLGSPQLLSSSTPIMALSADGNSYVQLQNPYNNIFSTSQGMIRSIAPQIQPLHKTVITNNGQQYVVQGGGQLNFLNQFPFNSMGYVVQNATTQQNQQQQQIINPIVIHPPTDQCQHINQSQITTQGTVLTTQQAQFITQNDSNNKVHHRMMVHQKTAQKQKSFFPNINKISRARNVIPSTTTSRMVENLSVNNDEEQDDGNDELVMEQEEYDIECEGETEHDELELSFDEDDKPDMIEELNHGTAQQLIHSSALIDGHCGIMNIDDITIEMDEINDLNEYLNAIDDEDNRISQIGLSSLQNFTNSTPDTTTHSPRSTVDFIESGNIHHIMGCGSEKSNGSSESNNMVSSSELDSNVVSPESHHFTGSSQSIFKLPMEPRSSNIKSPLSYSMINTNSSIFSDNNCQSPLMKPDSYGGDN